MCTLYVYECKFVHVFNTSTSKYMRIKMHKVTLDQNTNVTDIILFFKMGKWGVCNMLCVHTVHCTCTYTLIQ